jgi:hypothetical protein
MSLFGWLDGSDKTAKKQKQAAAEAAKAAREAAAAQAKALRFNAAVFESNAKLVEEKSLLDEGRNRRTATRFMGEFEASISKSGFADVNFDGMRENNETELDIDALIIRRQGQAERADYLANASLKRMEADAAIKAGEAAAKGAILQGQIAAQQTKTSSFWSGVGTVTAIASISDRSIKRDITRVGTLPSGLPVYRYRTIWSDEFTQGVMADEAASMFPDAVWKDASGLMVVDYARIA